MIYENGVQLFTDKGGRMVNEDCCGFAEYNGTYLFILCDGLGGHGLGDKASEYAVEFIKDYFLRCSDAEEFASTVIGKTHYALRSKQEAADMTGKMRTTCVILVLGGNIGISIHVGDSRLYRFRDNAVISRTRDHSIPQMLVMTGEIEEEIRCHPDRNKVLRALGDDHEALKCDISHFDVKPGDRFLLCSDGLWEPVLEEEMTRAMKSSESVSEWVGKMAAIARKNSNEKKMDNYTMIAAAVKG